jgi:hypothetical protein
MPAPLFVDHAIRLGKSFGSEKHACDPAQLAMGMTQAELSPYKFWEKANSFTMPRGKHPSVGYLLMLHRDIEELKVGLNEFDYYIQFYDSYKGGVTINNLAIARMDAVTGMNVKNVAEVMYLVQLVDARAIAHYSAVDKVYNVRSYQYLNTSDQPDYYGFSLNGGSVWTWQQIVEDLWNELPSPMGSPIFDVSWPTHTPENYQFRGMNAWDAINYILDTTGHTVYPNLLGQYTIAPKGKNQNIQQFEQVLRNEGYTKDMSWDYPDRKMALGIPEKVTVYFHTAYHAFQNVVGTDPNFRVLTGKDAWLSKPLYKEEYTSSTLFTDLQPIQGTNVALHDSLCAYYDEQGSLLNAADLTQRATDVAEGYLMSKSYRNNPVLHGVYLGYHPEILPGPEVECVRWFEIGRGSRTEILLSPLHYTPEDQIMGLGQHYVNSMLAWESVAPPDVARAHEPTDRMILCKVYGGDIPKEDVGQAKVLYGTHTGNSKITWAETSKLINLHNPWPQKIAEDTRVMAFWHLQTRRWVVAYVPRSFTLYTGELQAAMCPADKGIPKSYKLKDITACKDVTPVYEVENPLKLAAKANKKFVAFHNCELNEGNGGYQILQVEHDEFQIVIDQFTNVPGCVPELDTYGNPTGRNTLSYECKVKYRAQKFSLQTCADSLGDFTLVNAEARQILTDWWVDGLYIKGRYEPAYVLCPCDPYDEVLHIGADCATGSGSGSGSGSGEDVTPPVPCCDPMPEGNLTATVQGFPGCECMNGFFTLAKSTAQAPGGFTQFHLWSGTMNACGFNIYFEFLCKQLTTESTSTLTFSYRITGTSTIVAGVLAKRQCADTGFAGNPVWVYEFDDPALCVGGFKITIT